MAETICAVCEQPAYFRWSDTHGVGVCDRCGLPYTLYHYENNVLVEKAPSVAVKESWLSLAREYWNETHQRVFPGAYDMGIFRSRGGCTYSGATEDQMREFDEWLDARKDRWPEQVSELSQAADAVDPADEKVTG